MTRAKAAIASAIFLLIAPGFVAGLGPWWICDWTFGAPLFGWRVTRGCGAALVAAGLGGLLDSFARFAFQGKGTPAPVLPTESLVIGGLYRYVRNPMYIAVLCLIFGQGLLFGNLPVMEYGFFVFGSFHLFVWLYEEPRLRAKYGPEYEAYCTRVPRWIPRINFL